MLRRLRGARAGPVKILVYPGLGIVHYPLQRVGDHAALDDDADAGAGAKQAVEIVCDHDYRELSSE